MAPTDRVKRRCTYVGCDRPEESSHFYQIEVGRTSGGGQDWTSLAGSVLCNACYLRYARRGTLERPVNKPLSAASRRCTYAGCDRPDHGKHFYQIDESKTGGGRDWSSLSGHVLCHACYLQFRARGTLERRGRRSISGTMSQRVPESVHAPPVAAVAAGAAQIKEEEAAGGDNGGSRGVKREAPDVVLDPAMAKRQSRGGGDKNASEELQLARALLALQDH
jgi:hypothetical protein